MVKHFSLKQRKKDATVVTKESVVYLRIQKDVYELNLPNTYEIVFPHPDNLLSFKLIICSGEDFFQGGKFVFSFVEQGYPHESPKVKCEAMVCHPNIELEGNVCLNILREDWKPVLTINSVIYGLQYLFLEPNPEDPPNKEAAGQQSVQQSMWGSYISSS
ncbi:NEDD8-conjugating enzyme Ubc12-like [Hypanus sabinus]|uniref:NEDD8-conjugating enzyme Ubc12-like n=1 Tax=Hypanus sabinus TaxID=79690 RepID=UPI0028C3A7AF|nr:NEDD8-conjugating enzyme Ubc12-like [Hypanus sabinus]